MQGELGMWLMVRLMGRHLGRRDALREQGALTPWAWCRVHAAAGGLFCSQGGLSTSECQCFQTRPGHQFFFIVKSGGVFAYAFRDSWKEDPIGCPALDVKLSLDWEGTAACRPRLGLWLSGDLQQLKGDPGLLSTLGPSFLQCSPSPFAPLSPWVPPLHKLKTET